MRIEYKNKNIYSKHIVIGVLLINGKNKDD
jgi:hypothetical protein